MDLVRHLILCLLLLGVSKGNAQEPTQEELEKWFEDDSRFLPFETDISEGDLEFLAAPPEKPTLHSQNQLTITKTSISSGWVGMYQCYENLDAVPDAQVVYQYKEIKNLKIVMHDKIAKAWVQDQSVQLLDTQKGAALCVSADVRILYKNPDNTYSLNNGPFQRKFLDGFYPMHISLRVIYPAEVLEFIGTTPTAQNGFAVSHKKGELFIDAWFEGRLFTEALFKEKQNHGEQRN